jgi:hypothetical protein
MNQSKLLFSFQSHKGWQSSEAPDSHFFREIQGKWRSPDAPNIGKQQRNYSAVSVQSFRL